MKKALIIANVLLASSPVFGMNLDVAIDRDFSGKVTITERQNQENIEVSLNECCNLKGLTFCNFKQGTALAQNNSTDRFGTVNIYSDELVSIENITADSCKVFSPLLILAGRCKIDELTVQQNISLKNESTLISKQINFPYSATSLGCFYILGNLESDNLKIHGDRLTVTNKGSISSNNLELSNFGAESDIDFLQYGSFCVDEVNQYGRSFYNYGQTRIDKCNFVAPTTLEPNAGDLSISLLKGNTKSISAHGISANLSIDSLAGYTRRSLPVYSQSRSHFGRIEGRVEWLRNRSSFIEIDEISTDTPISLNSREGATTTVHRSNGLIKNNIVRDAIVQINGTTVQ